MVAQKSVKINEDLRRINVGVFRLPRWIIEKIREEYPRQGGKFLEQAILKKTGWKYEPRLSE